MVVKTHTVAEFEHFTNLPENRDRQFELIAGEIIEVSPSKNRQSQIAMLIGSYFNMHLIQNNLGGQVTGADGGYAIGDERLVPDVAYVSAARQPQPNDELWNPIAPDVVVEVVSPSNSPTELRRKLNAYLTAGCTVLVVEPEREEIEVHHPGQKVTVLSIDDTLTFDELPGFQLAVKAVFGK